MLGKIIHHPFILKSSKYFAAADNNGLPGTAGDVDKNNSSSPLESIKDRDRAGGNYPSNESRLMENNTDNEDIEIDESSIGEPWVQGLVEGEYSDLSVEERLHALVALIGVALEGNSIRIVLEVHLCFFMCQIVVD